MTNAQTPATAPIPPDPVSTTSAPIPRASRLSAHAVTLGYGGRNALDDVSIRVGRGELVALIGPNGAGKSTLLSAIAGDASPSSGTVHLDDRPLSSYRPLEMARLRAVLTQSNEVSFSFTVAEVVDMGRAPWASESDLATDRAVVDQALRDADLEHLQHRRVPELSGGERARVAYARVRAQGCDLLLLDEPTASLDIRHQERLLSQVREHTRAGGSAVVVLHDLNLAAAFADRVVLLDAGHVQADGAPHEVLTPALLSRVYQYPIRVFTDPSGELTILPHRTVTKENSYV
jgi:iron complex transport system ATP-binding protein